MQEYISENLKTAVRGSYNVVIAGAGPAGVCAAIAAGRAGASVLLIEKETCLGGMWTSGFVNPMFDYKNKVGLIAEIVNDLKSAGMWGGFWGMSFNYEYMKWLLEEKCAAAGVCVLYGTVYCGVITDGDRVIGVTVQNIEGRGIYKCSVALDCTSDASLAHDAGAETLLADGDFRNCQAMTLMFLFGNINEKLKDGKMIFEHIEAAYRKAGSEIPFDMPYLIPMPNSKTAVVQFTHIHNRNPLSAHDLSAAVVEGRKQVLEAYRNLKAYDPDFADIELITSAPLLGVRESRRIVGEYVISDDDIFTGAKFPDGICTVTFGVDIHNHSKGQTCRSVKPYQIPFRSLIPKGLANVIVAGKCISGSQTALASYRVTADCASMGEAAGAAAYEASAFRHGDVRSVSIEDIMKHINIGLTVDK